MKLAQALLLIPPGFHLQCGCEKDPETGEVFGSAALFEARNSTSRRRAVIVAISTNENDHEAFEALLVNMIVFRYGTLRQKVEARDQLDQMSTRRAQRELPIATKETW